MSNLDAAQSSSPESAYGPRGNPQLNAFARRIFFLSVGSAAVPVLFAAGIMLQGGHGLSSKRSQPKPAAHETRGALANANAPAATPTAHNPPPQSVSYSTFDSRGEAPPVAATGTSRAAAQPLSALDAEITRGQATREESDIFQRENLVQLAVISVPTSPGIPDTNSTAPEEQSPANGATAITATQAKKIRAETKVHTVAHHRHRSQRQAPPSLLAKIGQSVKKGLIEAAKFPREAMSGHLWE
jgi:hypothetical protein